MADAAQEPTYQHDGYKSRVLAVAASAFLLPFLFGSVALALGWLDSAQWVDMVKWLGTTVPTTYGLANVGQRLAARGQ